MPAASRIGANPVDYPEKGGKSRFTRFDIATRPQGSKQPNWASINAYGAAADHAVDVLELRKGDRVRITGFLAGKFGKSGCGRSHRFTVVVATSVYLIAGSKDRPESQWEDGDPELARLLSTI